MQKTPSVPISSVKKIKLILNPNYFSENCLLWPEYPLQQCLTFDHKSFDWSKWTPQLHLQNRPCLSMLWIDCFRLEYSNLPLCFWDAHLSNSLELEFHPQISLIWQSCTVGSSQWTSSSVWRSSCMHLLIAYWPKSYQCLSVALCKSWLYRWILTATLMF